MRKPDFYREFSPLTPLFLHNIVDKRMKNRTGVLL